MEKYAVGNGSRRKGSIRMRKILEKCGAVAGYLFLISLFFEFRIEKLFDGKQMVIFLIGTALLFLPSLGEKGKKTEKEQSLRHLSFCALWAGFLESLLLCLTALERMSSIDEVLPEFALCLRPVIYGVCVWCIFAMDTERGKTPQKNGEEKNFREITAGESYVIFQEMGLTKRECEIAILICRGMSNGEIAESLCISEGTVKKHVSNLFEKLGCNRREQVRQRLFSQAGERDG